MTAPEPSVNSAADRPDIIEPIRERPRPGIGNQRLYRFDNGYGASVIQGAYTYGGPAGLWELAVIQWEGGDYALTYGTPIADDVMGYLNEDEVQEVLRKIRALDGAK